MWCSLVEPPRISIGVGRCRGVVVPSRPSYNPLRHAGESYFSYTRGIWGLALASGDRGACTGLSRVDRDLGGLLIAHLLGTSITLLGGFRFFSGDTEVQLPEASERLIAYLAVKNRPVHRLAVAGVFWPDASESQALANLRSALWRLSGPSHDALEVGPKSLAVNPDVLVDLHGASTLARRVLEKTAHLSDAALSSAPDLLQDDLLVGWYDEWSIQAAERWRQLRLHALEGLARRLMHLGRYAAAVDVALRCIDTDPLRESAHAVVVAIHLAEDNRSEAIAAFDRYCATLYADLGLEPSEHLRALVNAVPAAMRL